jgi:hypothetical protein
MRILVWLPLAAILGLSLSLAILLARPAAPTIVLTIITPAAGPAPVVEVAPYWGCWRTAICPHVGPCCR